MLLIVLAGAVFDTLLLRRHLDSPLVLVVLLTTVWFAVAAISFVAKRVPSVRGVLSLYRRVNWPELVLLGFLCVLVLLFHQGYDRAASDGRDYFVQVRSMVFDRDFQLEEEVAAFRSRGRAPIYPIGTAILWLPFYLLGHAWLAVAPGASAVRIGYENPYQMAVGLGTVLYGFAALILIYRVLKQYYSQTISLASSIALYVGSFVLWYLTVASSMSHGASLFATTLFLYIWHQTRGARTLAQWSLLGAAAGLMAMVRWQDSLFMLVPAADAARDYWRVAVGGEGPRLAQLLKRHVCFLAMALFLFSPQLAFWASNPDIFSIPATAAPADWSQYEDTPVTAIGMRYGGVRWFNPQVSNVLFSSNHGLLAATPLLYLAVLGLVVFVIRAPFVGGVFMAGFLAQLYVNSVAISWWGGSGFGARRFASSALVFAVGLAALVDLLRRRPAVPIAAILIALVLGNAFVMLEVNRGRLPTGTGIGFDAMFDAAYTRIGNPFSFPANFVFAWRHRASPAVYDRLGLRRYNSLYIDLGEEDDDRFLGHGWSGRERSGNHSWRWAVTTESSIIVPLREPDDYRIRLRAEPFRFPDAPASLVTIAVNGEVVDELRLADGMHEYQVDVPRAFVRTYINEVTFVYRYAVSPRSVGLSDDPRPLAVSFDYISLNRAPD